MLKTAHYAVLPAPTFKEMMMTDSAVAKELIAARYEITKLLEIIDAAKEVVMYSKSTRDVEYTELEVLIDALGDSISSL